MRVDWNVVLTESAIISLLVRPLNDDLQHNGMVYGMVRTERIAKSRFVCLSITITMGIPRLLLRPLQGTIGLGHTLGRIRQNALLLYESVCFGVRNKALSMG